MTGQERIDDARVCCVCDMPLQVSKPTPLRFYTGHGRRGQMVSIGWHATPECDSGGWAAVTVLHSG